MAFLQQADFGQHWIPMPWVGSVLNSTSLLHNVIYIPNKWLAHARARSVSQKNKFCCTSEWTSMDLSKSQLSKGEKATPVSQKLPILEVCFGPKMNLNRGQRSSASHLLHLHRKPQLDSSRCRRTCRGTSEVATLELVNPPGNWQLSSHAFHHQATVRQSEL